MAQVSINWLLRNPAVTSPIIGARNLEQLKEKFDLIIVDSTDPVGPAEDLFNEEFYSNVSRNHLDRLE